MKKTLIFAGLGLILASCANESDVFEPASNSQQPISFRAVTQKSTKGAFAESNLPVETEVFVGAFNRVAATNQYTQYLNDAIFTCENPEEAVDKRLWAGDYFYPVTGDLDILAYTCDFGADKRKPEVTWTADAAGQFFKSMTLSFDDAPLNGQNDITYSELSKAVRLSAGGFANPSLKFHHAQAWVMVTFSKSGSEYNDDFIRIKNVKIEDVNVNGNFTLTLDADGNRTPSWTPVGAAQDELFLAFKSETPGEEVVMTFGQAAGADSKGILVLPSAEKVISFEYQTLVTEKNGEKVYTDWIKYETPVDASKNWQAEHKYVYQFSIVSNKIKFSTDVTSFDGTTENEPIQ